MREEKKYLVAELRKAIEGAGYLILTDYQGLTVSQVGELRGKLGEASASLQVVKNRLLKLAAEEAGLGFNGDLTGPTAIVVGDGDVTEVARVLRDYAKEAELPRFKFGFIEGQKVAASELQALAEMPPRPVLLAQLLGVLQAPARNLAGVLYAKTASIAYVLKAVLDKKQEQEG